MATGLYCSLFSWISLVLTSASTNLIDTSFDWDLVWFNTSISSVSSKRDPVDEVSFCNKFLSKICKSFLFLLTSKTKAFKLCSRAAYSLLSTLPKSCCSRPPWVTVKLIMVVFAESSGEKRGLGNLQVINMTKFLLYSICVPPTSMNLFLPLVCTYFSRTGSNIGSTSPSIPSMIKHFPSSIQNFKK